MVIWKVSTAEASLSLNAFLKLKFQNQYSAKQLKKGIEHNLCRVNNRLERFASVKLAEGDVVEFAEEQLNQLQQPKSTHSILYEDDSLLAYDKPAGLASDPEGIVKVVHQYNPNLKLVHRLDKDTSGVLLFAKNEDILQKMILFFKKFQVHKTYLALVDGILSQSKGFIENYLAPMYKYHGQTVWGGAVKGSRACTEWKRLKQGADCALLECHPITGITHQIRVHMHEIGHPILGDYQYGKHFKCPYRPLRHLLHASEIQFPHPRTGKKIQVFSSLPQDFESALKELHLS